ncbi:MAG: aminotransferase class I/II-fold pyridoxal phosphate-dependent enzyme [Spirochaetota bacterium]
MNESKPNWLYDCLHFGETPEDFWGAVSPPIFQNSLFVHPSFAKLSKAMQNISENYIYTRGNNPTIQIAERKIARLERGERAKCFGSGMAAISSAILSCVQAGDHILCIRNVYGGTYTLLSSYLKRFKVETDFITDFSLKNLEQKVKPNTRLIYLESPTTFSFQVYNLTEISGWARQKKIATIIDNTWATPYFQNPLEMGIDLVVHSCSKYLAGHSDVVAGVVVGKKELIGKIVDSEYMLLGGIIHPFEAWLLIRGLRTLPLRMERHFDTAQKVARFLEKHPKVLKVNYPLLPSSPDHDLAKKQLRGGAGLFSFELKTNRKEDVEKFVNALKLFSLGVSWGGYESLVFPLASLREADGTSIQPDDFGNSYFLIRLSVGLENSEDLISDLEQALLQVQT